jgi:hypothetical protein
VSLEVFSQSTRTSDISVENAMRAAAPCFVKVYPWIRTFVLSERFRRKESDATDLRVDIGVGRLPPRLVSKTSDGTANEINTLIPVHEVLTAQIVILITRSAILIVVWKVGMILRQQLRR